MNSDLSTLGKYYNKQGEEITFSEWVDLSKHIADRIIKKNYIGTYRCSTVWLGLDYNFYGGRPIIFETMIFYESNEEDELHNYQKRYSTLEEAIKVHEEAVKLCKEAMKRNTNE